LELFSRHTNGVRAMDALSTSATMPLTLAQNFERTHSLPFRPHDRAAQWMITVQMAIQPIFSGSSEKL
jgi:hypothetical protein